MAIYNHGSFSFIDVEHGGNAQVIGCCVIETSNAAILIDPGPASAWSTLKAGLARMGIGPAGITDILLTHIHLDHAGAAGTIRSENPAIRVHVHRRGAPHMANPERLWSSARRLYGDAMETLWGEMVPIPEDHLNVLQGGEDLELNGVRLSVFYTPGHASHHVCYLDRSTRTFFTGDTAGMRIGDGGLALPPTPPPDIDLELWEQSLQLIEEQSPERLVLTHFGLVDTVDSHLKALRERIADWAGRVRASLDSEGTDAEKAKAFAAEVEADLAERLPPNRLELYRQGVGIDLCWWGLARYWRKRQEAEAG